MTEALAFADREPRPAGPWQELAPAPGHRPVHTAIARSLFLRVVPRLGAARASPRRPDHRWRGARRAPDACAQRRVLPAARRRRADRLRRGVHGRRLGRRRPRRGAGAVRGAHVEPGARVDAAPAAVLRAPAARPGAEHQGRCPAQHRASLRPVERPLRALPRRVDDVLVRALRPRRLPGARPGDARSTSCSTPPASASARTCSRSAPAGAHWRCAAARRGATGHHPHPLPRAGRARAASARRGPACRAGSTCSCATTARSRAATTRSSASR